MYEDIIKKVADITNIRGRYRMSAALLDIELDRLAASRDFKFKYGKSEWVGEDNRPTRTVQLDDGEYKKLVVCLSDGSSVDVASMIAEDSMSCSSENSSELSVNQSCGMVTITAPEGVHITRVKAMFEKTAAEIRQYLATKFSSTLQSFLRWQLLSDIESNSAGVAYNTYIKSLSAVNKEPTL